MQLFDIDSFNQKGAEESEELVLFNWKSLGYVWSIVYSKILSIFSKSSRYMYLEGFNITSLIFVRERDNTKSPS